MRGSPQRLGHRNLNYRLMIRHGRPIFEKIQAIYRLRNVIEQDNRGEWFYEYTDTGIKCRGDTVIF